MSFRGDAAVGPGWLASSSAASAMGASRSLAEVVFVLEDRGLEPKLPVRDQQNSVAVDVGVELRARNDAKCGSRTISETCRRYRRNASSLGALEAAVFLLFDPKRRFRGRLGTRPKRAFRDRDEISAW